MGAVSGASPLIGWVAAAGSPTLYGWILFGILLPGNFLTSWPSRGIFGKIMKKVVFNFIIPVIQTALSSPESLFYTLILNFLVFAPYFFDLGEGYKTPGNFYLFSAIALTLFIMFRALDFAFGKNRERSASAFSSPRSFICLFSSQPS